MWLLGFELRISRRAVSALNHWAISPAPNFPLLQQILEFINIEKERIYMLTVLEIQIHNQNVLLFWT